MSAIAGVLYFEAGFVDELILEYLDHSLAHLGPDGSRWVISDSIAFLFRPFYTTPEAKSEYQPANSARILVSFDGRLDNRCQLSESLGAPRNCSDLDLIIAGYKKWGADCFQSFHGDFAIVIWDHHKRTLFLARDPFGIRRLFYHIDSKRMIWASDPAALLACPGVPSDVDETYIALFLCLLPDGSHSAFKSIEPVRAGAVTEWHRGCLTVRPFWGIDACLAVGQGVGRMSDRDYDERLRELLLEAVRVRLRADRCVVAELSGGLDSSSIVGIADVLSRCPSGTTGSDITTLSVVFEHATRSDERQFIRVMEEFRGHRGIYVTEDDDPILRKWPDPDFVSFPNKDLCFGGFVSGTISAMRLCGSRVLLSGLFGDQLLGPSFGVPYEAADYVRQHRFRAAISTCRDWGSKSGRPPFVLLWHAAIRPNLPMWLRKALIDVQIPDWIGPGLVKRTSLKSRLRLLRSGPRVSGSIGIRFDQLMRLVSHFVSGYAENQTTFNCIEMRYPYLHRPLVEFLISVPLSVLSSANDSRRLHRSTIKGIVPEYIRLRKSKGSPAEAVLLAVEREWNQLQSLLSESRAARYGYILPDRVNLGLRRWRAGHMPPSSDMLRFVALEMWLRALERRGFRA